MKEPQAQEVQSKRKENNLDAFTDWIDDEGDALMSANFAQDESAHKRSKLGNANRCRKYREKKKEKDAQVSAAIQSTSEELNSLKEEHSRDLQYSSVLQNLMELRSFIFESFRSRMESMSGAVVSLTEQAETIWVETLDAIRHRLLFPSDHQLRLLAKVQNLIPEGCNDRFIGFLVSILERWEVETPQGREHIEQLIGNAFGIRHRFMEILLEENITPIPRILTVHPNTARMVRESGFLQSRQLKQAAAMTEEQKQAIEIHYKEYKMQYAELQYRLADGYKLLEESLEDTMMDDKSIARSFFCIAQGSMKAEEAKSLLEQFTAAEMLARIKLICNVRKELTSLQTAYRFVRAMASSMTTLDIVKMYELEGGFLFDV